MLDYININVFCKMRKLPCLEFIGNDLLIPGHSMGRGL